MSSMQWQLGMLGTISAFAYRRRKTKKNLCRGGRSQDLPNTDFGSPVSKVKIAIHTHSTTNTHTMTTIHVRQLTIHTRQLQHNTQENYNNTHKTTTTIHTTITIYTRQLQQYTRPTNNNYTKDNLKLATIHARQIRILQHVQKVKTPK